ncbi:hypothetical protein CG405_01770 [Gardnerella vaginalis]|uniref:Uncharacterized protein n=1 Tax=Gardnerella vaginalis TaxID=2702 RepID=A0A2I1PM71_GARVA|nr:hypothetical protein EGX90_00440 [Gardnerella vaginalis]PKZ45727.1 hypothetical protein CYJ68_01440 [Gardnerella vaginalis]PKZ54130.1 hypothetical protein CYJ66_05195 [Gardnerella vaginalis]PKZ56242.1 hypothetical protein CYJ64_05195 [Gardnerella vaginalis]PKZ58966.1 hypothetical protein CYJ62_01260 [Gardnerella vaginalis]
MGSLKVLDGEWEKRFEGPLRETQQSASISPYDDYLQVPILHTMRTATLANINKRYSPQLITHLELLIHDLR